jgi:hypothetical protein
VSTAAAAVTVMLRRMMLCMLVPYNLCRHFCTQRVTVVIEQRPKYVLAAVVNPMLSLRCCCILQACCCAGASTG